MVILGGLEVVAAGYLLSEFNKDKVEARERRKRENSHHRPDDRPHSNRPSRPDSLRPPQQPPLRPSSAPPLPEPGPTAWQGQVPSYPGQPQQHRPPQNYPPQQQQHQQAPPFQFQQGPPPNARFGPGPPNGWQPGPPPVNFNGGPPPPNMGALNRPATFHPSAPQHVPSFPQQGLQQTNSFPLQANHMPRPQSNPPPPVQHQQVKPPPQGPLTYIDTKTGRVQHNLYPPDHPMARGFSHDDSEIPRDRYGDEGYGRTLPGDIHTGMIWSEADQNDLAYGHDYANERPGWRGREHSFERRRPRGRSSPPPPYR